MPTRISDVSLIQRGFSSEEFIRRTRALQQQMQSGDIDIVLFTTEPEVRYYSGFFTQFWQSPTRPWFLLVPQLGDPVAVIPTIGQALMSRTWLSDIRCWSSPARVDDGVTLLVDTIRELSGNRGTIGMMRGRESSLRMPLADYEKVVGELSNYRMVDVSAVVQSLRQIKSDAEQQKIAAACHAAGKAFADLPSWIACGMSEREIFQRFKLSCLQHGIDDVNYLVGAAGAGGYDDIIAPPGDRRSQIGDVLILDTGCVVDGYFCDFDRNFAFGTADRQTRAAYRLAHEAIDAALNMMQPGVSCAEIFQTMNSVIDPHSHTTTNSVGRMGHGLGTQLTESPSITAFDTTVMQPGMVMTLEPAVAYADGKLMVHEENVVVCADGVKLLTERAAAEIVIV